MLKGFLLFYQSPFLFPRERCNPVENTYDLWNSLNTNYKLHARPMKMTSHSKCWVETISARELFLCAGIAMSPEKLPSSCSVWGFFFEHNNSLRDANGFLRVNNSALEWDDRIKTLFSERIGLGLSLWFLWRHLGIRHIADAGPLIGKHVSNPASPYHLNKLVRSGNGGYKPDFFCLDEACEAVIAESKGAFGSVSVLKKSIDKGKKQTGNVNPVGVKLRANDSRIVLATNLRYTDEKPHTNATDTGIQIVDPEQGEEPIPVQLNKDEIVFDSYEKILRNIGLILKPQPDMIDFLVAEEIIQEKSIKIDINRKYYEFAKFSNVSIGLITPVAKRLFQHKDRLPGIADDINNILNRLESEKTPAACENYSIFPNGLVIAKRAK